MSILHQEYPGLCKTYLTDLKLVTGPKAKNAMGLLYNITMV